MNMQSTPMVNALAIGGPAVAVGGLSLLLIKKFVDHHWKSAPDLPRLPGEYSDTMLSNQFSQNLKILGLGRRAYQDHVIF